MKHDWEDSKTVIELVEKLQQIPLGDGLFLVGLAIAKHEYGEGACIAMAPPEQTDLMSEMDIWSDITNDANAVYQNSLNVMRESHKRKSVS